MSTTLDCEDIGIRKSEFVTKTQFLYTKIRIYAICIKVVVLNRSLTNMQPI